MRYGVILAALAILMTADPGAGQVGQPKRESLVDQVRKAIDEGVRFLRQNQKENGAWNDKIAAFSHPGGATCLALLALLECGVSTDDAAIVRGLKHIRTLEKPPTYVRSLQTLVYARAGLPEDRGRIQANVDHLLNIRLHRNNLLEGWSYDYPGNPGLRADNSNTQYAVMALHAGRLAGAKIARSVWEEIRDFYLRAQNDDGGWAYTSDNRGAFGKPDATLTMTNAGLSGLLLASRELNAGREVFQADGTAANCGNYKDDKAVQQALSWISSRDKDRFRLDLPQRTFSNLAGIERAGRLSGSRFFHSHDWYREGCLFLLRHKRVDPQGGCYWSETGAWDSWPVVSTSFSLLFLSKGRTPVLISKLAHGIPRTPGDGDWNNDRNDCRHLVEFAGKELFKRLPLAWQTFNLLNAVEALAGDKLTKEDEHAITSDLLESPIVYFNGHKSPLNRFTAVEQKLLKQYVDRGGFILAEACCGSKAFDKGFHALCQQLWPGQPLKDLPAEHPVWAAHFKILPGSVKLKGIQAGGKTMLIYSPEDLSCRWDSNKQDTPRELLAFRLGTNIIAHATGKQPPRPRLANANDGKR